jgi:ABC-type uncharacterized transport system involved in gliding motility auxiliary subunit
VRATRESRLQLRLASTSFVVLLLAVIGLLMWLSRDYHVQFDWTRNGRNTLSEASRNLLRTLDKPVQVTAFARQTEGVRSSISEFVGRYQKYKKDIHLEFVNPDTDPARTRAAGVRLDGELVVEYNGRKENLSQVTEEAFTNALARLGRSGERWVVFVTGHGERSPERQANFDLSTWSAQLAKRGIKTRTLALGGSNAIPENTSVLVIASPRVKYLAGEVKEIEQYLARGGNLLWLTDPGPLEGLRPVAETLGVEFQRGVVVDPTSQSLTGAPADFVVALRYGSQPVVRGFDLTTLFPQAQGLTVRPPKGWDQQTIVDTAPSAWVETGSLTGRIHFDADQDIRGPINLAVALTRKQNGREQRVAVFGDGDFLSNTFIGNGGNLELGMNLINWLSSDDAYINVPVRTAPDLSLTLSHNAQLLMLLGFLVALPMGLLGSGVMVWLRRRKR